MAANDVIDAVPERRTAPYALPPLCRAAPGRGEVAGYVAAVIVLIVGGMLARTFVLNWIVGPLVVVVAVALGSRPTRGRIR